MRIKPEDCLNGTDSMYLKMQKHREICYKMFDEIKSENEIYISLDESLDLIIENIENNIDNESINDVSDEYSKECESPPDRYKTDEERDLYSVRFSILSDAIVEYDEKYFSQYKDEINQYKTLDAPTSYRPYFVSFIAGLNNKDIIDKLKPLENEYYKAKFVMGKNAEAHYRYASDDFMVLSGMLETSASPITHIAGNLIVYKDKTIPTDKLAKINSVYDVKVFKPTANADIEKELNAIWNGDCLKAIDIYNVGHGNVDYLKGRKCKILYDIGYNTGPISALKNSKFPRASNSISKMLPDGVILSHWDLDHIMGCVYASAVIFNKKWIAPNLTSSSDKRKSSKNAVRLALYLHYKGNLLLVDRDQKNSLIANVCCSSFSSSSKIELYLGSGKDSKITKRNSEGLYINIINPTFKVEHVLLAGDVPYEALSPTVYKNDIDFLHVPHHCSNMNLDKLIKHINGSCNSRAIISTNRKKKTGVINRDETHYINLDKKFIEVIHTIDDIHKNDAANLLVRINLTSGTATIK